MNDQKPWWQSRSVIGSVVAILAVIAGFFHVIVAPEVQSQLVDAVLALVTVAGALVALVGRIIATKTLK